MAKVLLFPVFLIACISVRAQTSSHNAMYYFHQATRISLFPFGKVDTSIIKRCIVLYTKAIKLNPQFAEAYRNRGRSYGELKMISKAISDYTSAIKYDKQGDIFLYNNRAAYYFSNGEYQKAIEDYSTVLPLEDNRYTLYFLRAKAKLRLGLKASAIEDCQNAEKDNPAFLTDKEFVQLKRELGMKE